MSRIYSASFVGVAVTVAQDLFEINAPATASVMVHEFRVGQVTKTTTEFLRINVARSTGASGSGGSAVTPIPLDVLDTAFAGTCEANNTTIATTLTVVEPLIWNVVTEYIWMPTPECRILIGPSGRLVFSLITVPAASMTMSGTVKFECG